MIKKLKESLLGENTMYLGEKRVEIKKLTPNLWRQLFETIDKLPGLIVQVLLAPKEEFYSYMVSVCQIAMDEFIEIVSLLTGLEKEYIDDKVGLDEIITFLIRIIKRNNLGEVAKNLKSLLSKKDR
ncbi:hypothetical protein [Metabacillus bambusae]|uniref:Uncharacterized protein n=1 Tax=Metabacillus bambusae TaxID=2795218 RepID=A0ABS3N9U0_9BACI|nr:hypothetical protein [Metabacillus bambusae]MBO1515055.1 hypothetical protein [Metabacillus bambusae]